MRYRVRVTERAEMDVAAALDWFHEQGSIQAGARWFADLMRTIDTLETMPEIVGRIVHILRVWHGARDALGHADL
jgi:plasmid stabilization system protein ParE